MDIVRTKTKTSNLYLGSREFQLPELKMLVDVVQASPFLTQKKSMELIGKLEHLTSRYQAQELRRQVYVMNRIKSPTSSSTTTSTPSARPSTPPGRSPSGILTGGWRGNGPTAGAGRGMR